MNIIFFGTPDFAVYSLKALYESEEYNISAVVSAPDKERGRGRRITYSPVKQFAVENGLKILQPDKLNDKNFIEKLKSISADLFVVVAFRILPEAVFTLPPLSTFNLHGSLLPKYRGAAPIQWALINGETETGLTTFFLKKKVDTGDIILQEKVSIAPEDDFGSLHDKMAIAGARLVIQTCELIKTGNIELISQSETEASPAPKITKEMCKINWSESAEKIHNLIRGLSPFPGAYFELNDIIYKIYKSKINREIKLKPGEITQEYKTIYIGCSDYSLEILEIQREGRKRMTSEEFLRGYSLI